MDKGPVLPIRECIHRFRYLWMDRTTYGNALEIASSLLRRRNPSRVILRNGITIHAPYNSNILDLTREIFIVAEYMRHGLAIKPGDTVIDIGANIGVFTLYAANQSRDEGRVYAFEAHPDNIAFVRQNVEANHFKHVTVTHAAVSQAGGIVNLVVSPQSGMHWVHPDDKSSHGSNEMKIPSISLPDIMDQNKLNSVDFLKVDCEGSEGAILQGTPLHYLQRIKNIAMEFHDNVSSLRHDEIARLLESAGFTTHVEWD